MGNRGFFTRAYSKVQNKNRIHPGSDHDATMIHAVTSVTGNPVTINSISQNIGYYSFNKVKYIGQGADSLYFS